MSSSSPRRTVDSIDRRVGLIFGFFLVLLLLAVARAGDLGVFRAGALSADAASEHVQHITVPALRGEITDRSGDPLAVSEAADEIIADPVLVAKGKPRVAARELSKLLNVPQAKLLSELTKPNTQYELLTTQTPAATASKVMALNINGINDEPIEKRVYPNGTVGAQMIGWLAANGKGASGIEYVLNHQLDGTAGKREVVDDAMGNAVSVQNSKTAVPGKNVKLTISAPLESEVQSVLSQAAREYHATGATAIVTNPQTDQILALDNWPTMNDNDVTSKDLSSQNGKVPASEDMAVGYDYEPGSTFKAVTVGGALQDHVVTPTSEIYVPSMLDEYGKTISDAENHPNENLTVAQILKVSSNIGADEIAQRLGQTRFSKWIERFGFGKPTGVTLNGEEPGLVPKPGTSAWSGLSMYNLPFGQGEEVTPMQMVQAYDAIANGGILRSPELIESIGGKRQVASKGHRIISTHTATELRDMLRGVLADGGTASGAAIPGYDMAGKTGTAQVVVNGKYSNTLYDGSFIGMVPASHPKLVVSVLLAGVNNGYGGTVAAPVFQKIVAWAVAHFGINPCPSPCPASAMDPAMPNSL